MDDTAAGFGVVAVRMWYRFRAGAASPPPLPALPLAPAKPIRLEESRKVAFCLQRRPPVPAGFCEECGSPVGSCSATQPRA